MSEPSPGAGALQTPALLRRMACFLYEGVLLFGVLMAAGFVYSVVTQQRHALVGLHGMQAFLFVVLGAYFVWFWTRSGQTLAMQTWRIRLVGADGRPVGRWRALARYLLSWLWFLPALGTVYFSGLHGSGAVFGAMLAGVLAYALLSRLHPQRQFWHDAVCGTRLVTWQNKRAT
ncbi:MAG: RDD family protein [Rubrivivax sp.]